jgi:hypothetical protein
MDPVTGLAKREARALVRDGRRAGLPVDEALATALRFEAFELATAIHEEYDRGDFLAVAPAVVLADYLCG